MNINLILQNEFVDNLFFFNSDSEVKNDLYEFIISDFSGYDLICDFNDEYDYNRALQENPIWELLIDKINSVKFNGKLSSCLYEDVFYENIGEHNLFLTRYDKGECEKLSQSRGYLFLSEDNIDNVWVNYTKDKRTNSLKVSNSDIIPDILRLNCWDKLNQYLSPLTSIVIFDKYILNDSSGQKMTDNLFPLLEKLLQNMLKTNKVTISIICEPKGWDIVNRHTMLNSFIESLGYTSVKVNIIKHCKAFYPQGLEGLHGRVILTNYLHIRSDDSFNFFCKNRVNNDADVKVNFNLSSINKCFYEKDLMDLKKYVKRLSNNPNNPKEEYRILYYPSKSNYLLN